MNVTIVTKTSKSGHNRDTYDCTTVGDREENFPFGLVQLALYRDTDRLNWHWPILPWKQTWLCSQRDDGECVHGCGDGRRYRLAWAASDFVYGNTEQPLQGPHVGDDKELSLSWKI